MSAAIVQQQQQKNTTAIYFECGDIFNSAAVSFFLLVIFIIVFIILTYVCTCTFVRYMHACTRGYQKRRHLHKIIIAQVVLAESWKVNLANL